MKQYIDKDVVVAEIEKRIEKLKNLHFDTVTSYAREISSLERLLSFLDTLETKEVDFEKEVKLWIDENTCNGYCSASIYDTAEHFYELGIKAVKGE